MISTGLRWGFLNCFHCSLSKKKRSVKSSIYEHVVVSVRKKKKHYLYAHEQQIISGLLVPVRATASCRKQTHRERPPEGHLPNLALLLAAPHVSTSKRRTALPAHTHTHKDHHYSPLSRLPGATEADRIQHTLQVHH